MAFENDEMLVSAANPIIGGRPHVLLFLINAFLYQKISPEHSPGTSVVSLYLSGSVGTSTEEYVLFFSRNSRMERLLPSYVANGRWKCKVENHTIRNCG